MHFGLRTCVRDTEVGELLHGRVCDSGLEGMVSPGLCYCTKFLPSYSSPHHRLCLCQGHCLSSQPPAHFTLLLCQRGAARASTAACTRAAVAASSSAGTFPTPCQLPARGLLPILSSDQCRCCCSLRRGASLLFLTLAGRHKSKSE